MSRYLNYMNMNLNYMNRRLSYMKLEIKTIYLYGSLLNCLPEQLLFEVNHIKTLMNINHISWIQCETEFISNSSHQFTLFSPKTMMRLTWASLTSFLLWVVQRVWVRSLSSTLQVTAITVITGSSIIYMKIQCLRKNTF